MRTLVNIRFAEPMIRLMAMTTLPVAFCLAITADAAAQQPSPFGPQPGPFGPQQPPGAFGQQPPPGAFGQQPAPGGFGQPAPGGFGQPAPGGFGQPAPGGFGQPAPNGFGSPPGAMGQPPNQLGPQPPPNAGDAKPAAPINDDEERARTLINQPNTFGSTGLLRTSHAGSGAAGTFRVSFMSDFFMTKNFLCDPDLSTGAGQPITCSKDNLGDTANHVGAFFSVSATPVSFLEAFATIRTYANYNDQGKPKLLQVLGDTTLGVKAFTPRVGKYFSFGAEAQLNLLMGAGAVGPLGAGTGGFFRALATADLRKPGGTGVPLRINVNGSYRVDNTGQLVKEVESQRAKEFRDGRDRQPITRVERYGLGINRVDVFQPAVGFEVPTRYVQPYAEYSVDIPVNRQGYECHTGSTRISRGDVCLGLADFDAANPQTAGGPGYAGLPSRVSIGVRVTPFSNAFRGLSGHAGVDIGLSGTSVFIEELAPQAPWTVYLGLAYAYDTKAKKTVVLPPPPAPPPEKVTVPAPQTFVRGVVHETNKPDAFVADAVVTLEGSAEPPYATDGKGKFLTRHIEPGTYTFAIKAPGFKPGTCQATVPAPGAAATPTLGMGTAPPGQTPLGAPPPGAAPAPAPAPTAPANPFGGNPFAGNPFGAPTTAATPPATPPGGQPQPGQTPPGQTGANPISGVPGLPPSPTGTSYVEIDCSVEALPKVGAVVAKVKDAETGGAVPGAVVKAVDATGKERTATADGTGTVTFKDLPPGAIKIRAEAGGYMNTVSEAEIRVSEEAKMTLSLSRRPAGRNSLVRVTNNEIKILKQVHFETDSAKILGDSNALLEEVADVLQRNTNIRRVEVQGHTDNTGSREHNQQLSDQRAQAVRTWLMAAGVDGNRLAARGYGQDKPLGPNVTSVQKARNRRVQFIILEKTR